MSVIKNVHVYITTDHVRKIPFYTTLISVFRGLPIHMLVRPVRRICRMGVTYIPLAHVESK